VTCASTAGQRDGEPVMTQSFVVVGAHGGVGEALCRRLAKGGARVLMAGRDAQRLAQLATDVGGETFALNATSATNLESAGSRGQSGETRSRISSMGRPVVLTTQGQGRGGRKHHPRLRQKFERSLSSLREEREEHVDPIALQEYRQLAHDRVRCRVRDAGRRVHPAVARRPADGPVGLSGLRLWCTELDAKPAPDPIQGRPGSVE
jgi:hypothetical protein